MRCRCARRQEIDKRESDAAGDSMLGRTEKFLFSFDPDFGLVAIILDNVI